MDLNASQMNALATLTQPPEASLRSFLLSMQLSISAAQSLPAGAPSGVLTQDRHPQGTQSARTAPTVRSACEGPHHILPHIFSSKLYTHSHRTHAQRTYCVLHNAHTEHTCSSTHHAQQAHTAHAQRAQPAHTAHTHSKHAHRTHASDTHAAHAQRTCTAHSKHSQCTLPAHTHTRRAQRRHTAHPRTHCTRHSTCTLSTQQHSGSTSFGGESPAGRGGDWQGGYFPLLPPQ